MASLRSFASSAKKHAVNTNASSRPRKRTKKAETRVMDEVELDLYGPEPGDEEEDEGESEEEEKADNDVKMESDLLFDVNMEGVQSKAKHDMANPEGQSVQATHWCIIYRSDGALEVWIFFFFCYDNRLSSALFHQWVYAHHCVSYRSTTCPTSRRSSSSLTLICFLKFCLTPHLVKIPSLQDMHMRLQR